MRKCFVSFSVNFRIFVLCLNVFHQITSFLVHLFEIFIILKKCDVLVILDKITLLRGVILI